MGKADPKSGNHVVAGALGAGPRRNLASPMMLVPSPILVSSENILKILRSCYIIRSPRNFCISINDFFISITYFDEKSSSTGTIVQREQKIFLITRRWTSSVQSRFHV